MMSFCGLVVKAFKIVSFIQIVIEIFLLFSRCSNAINSYVPSILMTSEWSCS